MPRHFEPDAHFSRHKKGECTFCDRDAFALCAAFQLFTYTGSAGAWGTLRGFIVPDTGRYMDRTVWQLVLAAEGITDYTGGKYRDGGEVPTPRAVLMAIATAPIVTREG